MLRDERPIFVAGANGQVAHALVAAAARLGRPLIAHGRPAIDLENPAGLGATVMALDPSAIVNAAAYTAVDRAESEPERAFAVNRDGAAALARAARALGVPFVQLSTDYVFDGSKAEPYREDDATAPTSVYGASKRAGEEAVLAADPDAIVLRTSWVYGAHGANFVRTMLRLAGERHEIAVVADQFGRPTAAVDIAAAVLEILDRLSRTGGPVAGGVFHLVGGGETSWHGFAEAILAGAAARGGPSVPVRAITTAEYPTPARRPANSRLDDTRLAERFGIRLPPWRQSLEGVLDEILGPRR